MADHRPVHSPHVSKTPVACGCPACADMARCMRPPDQRPACGCGPPGQGPRGSEGCCGHQGVCAAMPLTRRCAYRPQGTEWQQLWNGHTCFIVDSKCCLPPLTSLRALAWDGCRQGRTRWPQRCQPRQMLQMWTPSCGKRWGCAGAALRCLGPSGASVP